MRTYQPPIYHTIPGYETVIEFEDQATNLHGFIAIHNTKRGPSLGGTRIWNYSNKQEALTDVLRLAQGMTFKAAGADLALGGGKGVLIGKADAIKSPAFFHAYGHYVELLKGRYITAEDVNTTTEDMKAIAKMTKHVVGREGQSGNPSPWTAYGVYVGLIATVAVAFPKKELKQLSFAVQGVGQTGSRLVDHLVEAGVTHLYISDVNPHHLNTMKTKYPFIQTVQEKDLFSLPVDVLCPCALGGVIDETSLKTIQAKAIAGSANNILLDPQHGKIAQQKGILIAPDFIINAGGLINVYHEHLGDYDPQKIRQEVSKIGPRLTAIYQEVYRKKIDPLTAAMQFVSQQLK